MLDNKSLQLRRQSNKFYEDGNTREGTYSTRPNLKSQSMDNYENLKNKNGSESYIIWIQARI